MRNRHLTFMMGAALVVAAIGAGCSHKAPESQPGSARIAVVALAYTDISNVTVTVTSNTSGGSPAAITKPIVVPLGKKTTGNNWGTTVQGIPAGDVTYTGNAYNGSTLIFTGSINGTVTPGGTANVTINLFQATANTFANNAPIIDALQVGTSTATPGQVVNVGVVAHDLDATDILTYAWTATCGTFAAASSAATTWTAPASSSAPCVLTVTVMDNHGAANTATASVSVQASSKGGAAITVAPDLAPIITGITVNVTDPAGTAAAFSQGNVAHLAVVATDDNPIVYAWSVSGCTGTFTNASIVNPNFTVSSDTGICTFTVVVTDEVGQPTTGTLTLPIVNVGVGPAAAPVIEVYSASSESVAPGQTIWFNVVASQVAHDGLTFAWTGNPGSAPGYTQVDSNDPAFATPSSTISYVAPADLGNPSQPVVITVTVTDTVNGLTAQHVWNLVKANDPCAGGAPSTTLCDDGNACSSGDHCDGAGHCVAGTTMDCSTGMGLCQSAGPCNPASGLCVYPSAPAGTTCDDSNLCTTSTVCNGTSGTGSCVGTAVTCSGSNPCMNYGTCAPATGCPAAVPANEGASCNDSQICTTGETCQGGTCTGGAALTCSIGAGHNPACYIPGICSEPAGCGADIVQPGNACDDGNLCTETDVCTSTGGCAGAAKVCPTNTACNPANGNCDPVALAACMAPTAAQDWLATTAYVAAGGGATPKMFATGILAAAGVNFGAGTVPYAGDSDVYVNALDASSGLATWSKSFGDASGQLPSALAVSSGSVGLIGNYMGNMTGTAIPANTNPAPVDFILGLSQTDGSALWGKKVDMAGGGLLGIASNPTHDYFYVCGLHGGSGAATPAGSVGATDLVPGAVSAGGKDIVVAKINAATGAVAWARQVGAAGDDSCTAIAVNDAGTSVFITGTYANDALDLGTGPFPAATSSQARIYLARLDAATGATQAANGYGQNGRQLPLSLTTDPSGNVVLGGAFLSTITFATGISIASNGNQDAFIAKFDANTVPLWAMKWGQGGSSANQKIASVATDSSGNIFGAGLFQGGVEIGPAGATVNSAGSTDAFTVKLSPSGALVCGANYGDAAGQQLDSVAIARFSANQGMISGVYTGTLTLSSTLSFTSAANHTFVSTINANSL